MKNSRELIELEDAQIVGRALAIALPRQPISVPASGQSHVTQDGGKCFHGVYIPASSRFSPDIAPDCTLCRPYELIAKPHAIFKA